MITQEHLMGRLSYDQVTGVFTWKYAGFNKKHLVGMVAGCLDGDGYIGIKIDQKSYKAHNLAWIYLHGKLPEFVIDHIDGIKTNNAASNLRSVTYAENSQNQRAAHVDSKNGYLGVDYNASKRRFRARIQTSGKRVTLGGFDTAEQAHIAYVAAKRVLHVGCSI